MKNIQEVEKLPSFRAEGCLCWRSCCSLGDFVLPGWEPPKDLKRTHLKRESVLLLKPFC